MYQVQVWPGGVKRQLPTADHTVVPGTVDTCPANVQDRKRTPRSSIDLHVDPYGYGDGHV